MGPAREKRPGDERSRVGRGGEYVTGQFAGGGCGVVECPPQRVGMEQFLSETVLKALKLCPLGIHFSRTGRPATSRFLHF
mgnify:FL=1